MTDWPGCAVEATDHTSVQRLVSCGWLNPEAAAQARVDTTSSSHIVCRVVAPDGRTAIVKQQGRHGARRGLERELFVYRLAHWLPDVAAAVPHSMLLDEKNQLLAIEPVGDVTTWPPRPTDLSEVSGAATGRLGALMAGWHRVTQDLALWPSPAVGILHMPDALGEAAADRATATRQLMETIVEDEALSAVLRLTRQRWRDRCLVHGDLRRDNWFASDDGSSVEVKVVDWELAGSGDPAWDLGSVVAEFVLDDVRREQNVFSPMHKNEDAPLREFFGSYVDSGGLLRPKLRSEREHVIMCAVARLLHVACEWSEMQSTPTEGPAWDVVELARRLLHDADHVRNSIRAAIH